METEGWR